MSATKRFLPCFAVLLSVIALAFTTGCGSTESEASVALPRAAIGKYREYLKENADLLVEWTAKMRGQIAVGDLTRAESRYATARVAFGHLEPVARTLHRLYPRIDGQATSKAGEGYHQIEKGLFMRGSTQHLKPVAKQLLANVERLRSRLSSVPLPPQRTASDAAAMLGVVATSGLAGREERFSHLDLVDISASIEGAQAAFDAAGQSFEDASTSVSIERAFDKAYSALTQWGIPAKYPQERPAAAGARFTPYTELSGNDRQRLSAPIDELSSRLARASDEVKGVD